MLDFIGMAEVWGMDSKRKIQNKNVGWLVVLRIYFALAIFQSYRDLEAGDNQSLKS